MKEESCQAKSQPETMAPPIGELGEGAETAKKTRTKKTYRVEFLQTWCKSCGICVSFCPLHCIALTDTGNPLMVAAEKCSGCGWCELYCPDFAITVEEIK